MLGAGLRSRFLQTVRANPDVMLYAAEGLGLGALARLARRRGRTGLPAGTVVRHRREYLYLGVPLVVLNGFVHYRLRRDRAVKWCWLLLLSSADIGLITAAVIIGGEFHLFVYVAYYPALALFAAVFTSLWLSVAWTTMAAAYGVVSLTVGSGLDLDAGQERS